MLLHYSRHYIAYLRELQLASTARHFRGRYTGLPENSRYSMDHDQVPGIQRCTEYSGVKNIFQHVGVCASTTQCQGAFAPTSSAAPQRVEPHPSGGRESFGKYGDTNLIRSEASVDRVQRTKLLRANGRDPGLIRMLLGDAQLWDRLRRSCRKQIAELEEFRTSYESKLWAVLHEDESVADWQAVETLKKAHSEGLETLTDTSKDLIQLVLDIIQMESRAY